MNLPDDVRAALDKMVTDLGIAEELAIAVILRDWLIAHGYMEAVVIDEETVTEGTA